MKRKLFFPIVVLFFAAGFFVIEGKQNHARESVVPSSGYQPGEPDLKINDQEEAAMPSLTKLY